jgi:murein DD-endopeptidase MepM/ murein hydrolase activator NlpD
MALRSPEALLVWWSLAASGCASTTPLESAVPAGAESEKELAPRSEPGQRTELRLPFDGTWVVLQGNHGAESHHGRAAYALDLVKLDAKGRAYARQGKRTSDWAGFGADLLATADGVVVRAIDRFPDNRVMGEGKETNTVIVQHTESELSEYVHVQHGSLQVKVGERVQRGQVLARCGSSGAQTPHLHWALLSSLDPIRTRPATFARYEVMEDDGVWRVTQGTPREGQRIRSIADE